MPAPYLVETAAATPPPLIAAPITAGAACCWPAPRPKAALAAEQYTGRYVVQLGAFSSATKVESAWRKTAQAAWATSPGSTPSQATTFGAQKIGTVYRLSLAGFETRAAAVTLCLPDPRGEGRMLRQGECRRCFGIMDKAGDAGWRSR